MPNILPQQRLLLELLIMSGDIAIAEDGEYVILRRTLEECIKKGWVTLNHFGAGFEKAAITEHGREAANYKATA